MHLGVIGEHTGEPWGGVQSRAEVNGKGLERAGFHLASNEGH